jgi:hypothetical protein
LLLLVGIELLASVRFKALGQADHSVDEAKELQDQGALVAALAQHYGCLATLMG